MSPEIKVIFTDCDGVLTDGKIYYDDNGKITRSFNSLDGEGFALARKHNIKVVIVTSQSARNSDSIQARAYDLNVPVIFLKDKTKIIKSVLQDPHLEPENIVFIGNDIRDVKAGKMCGTFFMPLDTNPQISKNATKLIPKRGGEGAFRWVVDTVIGVNRGVIK